MIPCGRHCLLTCAFALAAAAGFPPANAAAVRPSHAGGASRTAAVAPAQFHLQRHPVVALTFDDMPAGGGLHVGETRTGIAARLAGELKASRVKGVYAFVNAVDVANDPDMQQALRLWLAAGMKIGNHTWSHPALDDATAEAFEHEIALDEPLLRQYDPAGDWHWFRYPYLEEGNTVTKREQVRGWLGAHHYRIAEVTLNFQDDDWDDPYGRCLARRDDAAIAWLKQSYMENAREFLREGREEEIIAFGHEVPNVLLLHETDFTTLMLPSLMRLLRSQGFRFASLSKVERNPVYLLDPAAPDPGGGSLTNQVMDARHLRYPPFRPEPVDRLNSLCQ